KLVGNPRNGFGIVVGWTEIPGGSELRTVLTETLGKHQVTAYWFQHELPGPNSARVANQTRSSIKKCPNEIWNELVGRPIATANCISRPCTSDSNGVFIERFSRKKRITKSGCHEFRARLGICVRIATTHGLVLAVAPNKLAILITLIARYIDHSARPLELTYGFEEMHRTHYIRGVGLNRFIITSAHNRLRRHMNDYIGPGTGQSVFQTSEITDIGYDRFYAGRYARLIKQIRLCWRLERVSSYVGAQCIQPQAQPATFEAGVTGHEYVAAFPKQMIKHVQN